MSDHTMFADAIVESFERHVLMPMHGSISTTDPETGEPADVTPFFTDKGLMVDGITVPRSIYFAREGNPDQDKRGPALYEAVFEPVETTAGSTGRWYPLLYPNGEPMFLHDLLGLFAIADADERGDDAAASALRAEVALLRTGGALPAPVPTLTAIKPHRHIVPNSKVTHALCDPEAFEPGGIPLSVGRKMGQTVIDLALSVEDGEIDGDVVYSRTIDPEDKEIISAVSTLKEAATRETGEPVVSAYNICETMGIKHPEPNKQADVDERMAKLMGVTVRIDFTEQAKQRKLVNPNTGLPYVNPDTGLPFDRAIISGHVIEASRFEGIDTSGNKYVRYRLLADPPTYEHAKAVGQVIEYPQRLLSLPPVREDGKPYRRVNTGWQTEAKFEILRRVSSMKNPKNKMSNTIVYDTLCKAVGIDPENRGTRRRVIEFTEAYLRALHQEGIIHDFQPHEKMGRSHKRTGVDVFVKRT